MKSIPNSPHVLVIDGEHTMRVRLRMVLEAAGCEVSTATDGHMALDLLASAVRPPGLIFLDPATRLIDRRDFMSRLHQNTQWTGIPVVVLQTSGSESPEGAVAVISKRASDDVILATVMKHAR